MSETTVPPPMMSVPEAQEKAAAFQKELDALIDRYDGHAFFAVMVFQTSQLHDIWYTSTIRGCTLCIAKTIARIITQRFSIEHLDLFTRLLAGFNAENLIALQDPAIADLEKLPVALDAEGKPYKN